MDNNESLKGNERFLSKIGINQLLTVYELLPDVLFWIKDEQGKLMYCNENFINMFELGSLEKSIGKSDFDMFPNHIAKQFVLDDELVLQGKPISERLEMNIVNSDAMSWFITNKRPLYLPDNSIIGSYGCSRLLDRTKLVLNGMDALNVPVQYVKQHYMDNISVNDLAEVSYLSLSALERRFKKYLAKTPKQFINEVRLENARRLLIESDISISSVADKSGFTDHSYFSRRFYKQFGESPSEFRENHRQ